MASSSEKRRYRQAFLSSIGTDMPNNFLCHLRKTLDRRHIHPYKDDEESRKGEYISPARMEAIEDARVAVVAFSQNYAESTRCLEELAKIMECNKRNKLIVLPLFYKVEPREVREHRESYGVALAKHELQFEKDPEKVQKWKKALVEAGGLPGWQLHDGDEAEFIQRIVREALNRLGRLSVFVERNLIGISSRVEQLKSKLSMESEDAVRMVGLWGLAGIGKSTIAATLYNSHFGQFERSSFLPMVWFQPCSASFSLTGRKSRIKYITDLQKRLLSDMFISDDLVFSSVDGGIQLIQETLCRKKVLIILDDVDSLDQLNALVRSRDWFGKGSRIIITTRYRHFLTYLKVDDVYEVNPLTDEEAYELFREHRLRWKQDKEVSENTIQDALHFADGLPLALKVLGSSSWGGDELSWESMFTMLRTLPMPHINLMLMDSYNALQHNEREIFLDIACFFRGCRIEYVKKVLRSCYWGVDVGLQALIERALIRIENGFLEMHGLVQLMGRDFVNRVSRDDPKRRSRLWLYADVKRVLERNEETDAIRAIKLELQPFESITFGADTFAKLKKLRVLIVRNVPSTSPVYLPPGLRWVELKRIDPNGRVVHNSRI